jgi:3-oxoacyl-(acyl-carrier-protein) synthase
MQPIAITGHARLCRQQPAPWGSVQQLPVATLPSTAELTLALLEAHGPWRRLDRVTRLALYCGMEAVRTAGWDDHARHHCGINLGTARGATATLEATHAQLLETGSVPPHTSPATTAGHIAAALAQALQSGGPAFSHSITCSSSGFALANAAAWLRAGMATHFVAGGTEAPLTPYVLAQMQALGIYAQPEDWPCRPFSGAGGLLLGEGAAVFALQPATADMAAIGYLQGFGFGNEAIPSATGISADGACLQRAMQQALAASPLPPDLILAHAPGTRQGDAAEWAALQAVFGDSCPPVYSTKWYTGHTFGAAAAISLAVALDVLAGQPLPQPPFDLPGFRLPPQPVRSVLVNSVGFGGNAVSFMVTLEPHLDTTRP